MFDLRPYQQRALGLTRQAISQGNHSIMVQAPTGSGKGVLLSHIINSANDRGKTVLFLVHLQEILYQTSAYLDKYGIDHGIIKAGEVHEDWHPVQIASFQTLLKRMDKGCTREADIVIIDEAHHATAETYMRVIEYYRKKLIIGFSATPTRKNGMGLGNMFDSLVQVATVQELTGLGFLAPIRYFAPVQPDLETVKMQTGDYSLKTLEPAMMKNGMVGDLVGHWFKYGENRKTVVFATGVSHSIAIKDEFLRHGIKAEHLDGKTKKGERDSIVERFKTGDTQVIVNCQILTEGVDVPDIGCVVLARPTKSLGLYLQMTGRGMRTVEGKTDMILIDHAGACYEHGFVHEINDWELSTQTKTVNKDNEKRKAKESKPITCPQCACIYTKQLPCPECGHVPDIKQFGKDVKYIDGVLGEVCYKTKKAAAKEYTPVDKISWYSQLVAYGKEKDYKPGWAAWKYQQKFGVWPKYGKHVTKVEVSQEVRSFILHQNIKAHHAKKNTEPGDAYIPNKDQGKRDGSKRKVGFGSPVKFPEIIKDVPDFRLQNHLR